MRLDKAKSRTARSTPVCPPLLRTNSFMTVVFSDEYSGSTVTNPRSSGSKATTAGTTVFPQMRRRKLRWTPTGTETHDAWMIQPISKTRPTTLVENLAPGTAYVFQVRALTKSGFTNWSDSVTRMCTQVLTS